jgi:hypothetical protein
MKKFTMMMLPLLIIGNIGALDTESYQFIDHLLRLTTPGAPEIFEDGVLFTAPSSYRTVGIAFAHEGFAKIYWFKKIMTIRDDEEETTGTGSRKRDLPIRQDSGILFHTYTIPQDAGKQDVWNVDARHLEYRLIIDGLWTVDPLNPLRRLDEKSGILRSVIVLPEIPREPAVSDGPPGTLSFNYLAEPKETVTVAGDFNGWDPFMYELRETSPGRYSLVLPLPPGIYRYVFYHRGQRFPDPGNPGKVYSASGEIVSEAVVR